MKAIITGKNQIEISTLEGLFLQSYENIVACKIHGKAYVTDTHYSSTTTKHISAFLNGKVAETKPQSFFEGF